MSDPEWSDQLGERLSEEDIAAYLDGFADAAKKTARHLERCSYCREFIRILEATPRPEQMERLKTWRCASAKSG